ncbi:LPXTG cell wall anchor domain-containing protein [Streptacidiphilus carbonis]|uniref:LPXTG cell wall anchor domain-containing protein n=1 Tax=Streptacidiphilus carbonis TaxID=105422 RepID=UPI0005A8DA55|nr:LPXTG cell wall anchor domain-containing protein [Streptacidiphilus carbonis]
MGSIRTRRALSAAAALAVTGTALLAGAGTAFAADALHINISEWNLTLPKAVNGTAVTRTLHVEVAHDLQGHVPSATLTVDVSGLAGVADVVWPAGCTHTGTVGTCTISHVDDISSGRPPTELGFGLKADAKAADGAQGTLDFKATAPGLASYEVPETVSVGSGADLTIQQLSAIHHAKVGSTLSAPIQWANTGNETAPSTVLTLDAMAGLEFKQHYSNCTYSKPTGDLGNVEAVCTINTPLAPGQALRLVDPVQVGVTSEAWYTLLTASVLPPGAQAASRVSHSSGSTRGTGPELTAEAVPASSVHSRTADINPQDSYTELDVYADNHAHYSAVGGSARGTKGQTVDVTVGMRNNGPALIYDRSGGDGMDALKVTFPAGTTVTKVPDGCELAQKGAAAGHGPYECNSTYAQAPGYQVLYTFKVRLDAALSNAVGSAKLTNEASDYTGVPVSFPWDDSTSGYTAPIVFNGTTGTGGSPSTPASATASPSSTAATTAAATGGSASPSAGPTGGSLAATGGGSSTGPLLGAGAAALALGAGALVLTRRRKAADHT